VSLGSAASAYNTHVASSAAAAALDPYYQQQHPLASYGTSSAHYPGYESGIYPSDLMQNLMNYYGSANYALGDQDTRAQQGMQSLLDCSSVDFNAYSKTAMLMSGNADLSYLDPSAYSQTNGLNSLDISSRSQVSTATKRGRKSNSSEVSNGRG
ncbi:hypothetical protein Ciccas_013956, partial [Cichlidogyrus casuarinus]